VKQFFLVLISLGAIAPILNAQNVSSGGGSPVASERPKQVRAAPKHVRTNPQPAPIVRGPAMSAPARQPASVIAYSDALGRYQHARHSRFWWKHHFTTIVFVGGGYYYFDSGYWFPAWGYDPNYEAYDYDGPIFTYGNLLPDQVIVNVQRALQDLGYYGGGISGALSPATRRAISAFQADEGLEVNGVVDGPTVYALGLI